MAERRIALPPGWATKGRIMPIRPLLNVGSGVFGPDVTQDVVAAFEALLKELGLTDRSDPATHD
jgi:hypothetical protein